MKLQAETVNDGAINNSRRDLDPKKFCDARGQSGGHFPVRDGRTTSSVRTGLADMLHEDQEHAEDIAELLQLRDTDPEEFDKYVQMAEDASKLASERPEMFEAIMRHKIPDASLGEKRAGRSNAREHQKRALNAAASQVSRADGDTRFGHLKLPGRRTAGSNIPGGNEEGLIISPEPGFVIKTRSMGDSVKVFVNVCQHERVGDSGFVKKLDKDGNEVEGLNVPMSVGPPCVDRDNAGQECIVYDVIINPKAMEECANDKTGARRDWLCHLAMQSVMAKYACQLDPKYKLPKLKFKGDKEAGPAPQRIRDDSAKPRISDLSLGQSSDSSCNEVPNTTSEGGTTTGITNPSPSSKRTMPLLGTPTTTALWKHGSNSVPDAKRETDVGSQSLAETVRSSVDEWPDLLQVSVGFPQEILDSEILAEIDQERPSAPCLISKTGWNSILVEVTASSYEVTLQAVGYKPLQLRLPYAVLPNTAFAQANSHQGTLVVNIIVDKTPIWTGPDVGSKPWLLAHALGGVSSRQVSSDVDEANMDVRDNRSHEEDTPYREGDCLPEDRFHKADIISQHAIDTRQHQRREKTQRAEEERDARKKDPQGGVEYVDLGECHSQGKSDRPVIPCPDTPIKLGGQEAPLSEGSALSHDISTAARVLSDAVKGQESRGAEFSKRLSASGWTELLP